MTIETYVIDDLGRVCFVKDPDAVLDYTMRWLAWLAEIGDTLSAVSVTAIGVTVDSDVVAGTDHTAWVSGGVTGQVASLTFRIVTFGGRTDERTIYLKITQR